MATCFDSAILLLTHGGVGFRYREMPPFGHAVIRKFGNNASAMKKLAARDFEDLLQVRYRAFESLSIL